MTLEQRIEQLEKEVAELREAAQPEKIRLEVLKELHRVMSSIIPVSD